MSDDVKFSEGGPIDLSAQPLGGDFELPKSDDADFDLDQFLAENTDGNTANADLDLPQGDFSFDHSAEQGTENVELADMQAEPDDAFKDELEQVPGTDSGIETVEGEENKAESKLETETLSEPEIETGMEPVEGIEVEESSGVGVGDVEEDVPEITQAEDVRLEDVNEEDVGETNLLQTEEDVVKGDQSKGWAFEGIETNDTEEDATSVMGDDDFQGFEPEIIPASSGKREESIESSNIFWETTDVLQETNGYARWYSGNYDDGAFELDKQSVSGVLNGDDEHKTIHVNVGYDTYGWQVEFTNGVIMNLRDVREYQLKNGALPAAEGMIVYGNMRMKFSHIEKITLYENVRYFTYMPN